MKRKVIGIVMMTLLIATTLTSVGMHTTTIDEHEAVIATRYQRCDACANTPSGIFNPPVMDIQVEPLSDDPCSSQPTTVDLPEYFSWRDHDGQDWTTPVRNQGNCGSCWDFAALGALESVINIGEGLVDLDPDLSEQYVLSCLTNGGCNGGGGFVAFERIFRNDTVGNNCNGIIPESCMPYQASHDIPCDEKWENWVDYIIPISDFGKLHPANCTIDSIKSLIIEKGPIVTCMNALNDNLTFSKWGYTNHEEDDYFPYEYGSYIDHLIVIVGWKDDPTIEHGGYWICKNSWGPTFGYDGFFNIEYDSLRIGTNEVTWVDYNPDEYDWHPVPKVNGPYYGLVGETIDFQGEASGEHPPFTYNWDFGDDSMSTEQNPSHTYFEPGEFSVRLTVSDEYGKSMWVETFAWIQETNQPPFSPTIEGPSEIAKGKLCWYNFTFTDPDESPLYLYVVAFSMESNIWWGPYPTEWGKEFIQHYWEEEGDHVVKAKVKDPYGAESEWTTLEIQVSKNKASITSPTQQFLVTHPYLASLVTHLQER